MDDKNPSSLNAEQTAAANAEEPKRRGGKRRTVEQTSKSASKSKKDQLIGLLSKPSGARLSVLAERLQWQVHTVRAALSGLRKQGFEITTSKSAKTGETVYAITGQPVSSNDAGHGVTA